MIEPFQSRLKRFLFGSVHEIPMGILNSLNSFWMPSLKTADENKLDGLVFLGTHTVMQTVGKHIFGKSGPAATLFYLEHFVDGDREDLRFSAISGLIHEMRNVIAHQWFSAQAYDFAIDYTEEKGWWNGADGVHINPSVYLACFGMRFPDTRPETDYRKFVSDDELRLRKYSYIAEWLRLDPKHPARAKIENLGILHGSQLERMEEEIQAHLAKEFGLPTGP